MLLRFAYQRTITGSLLRHQHSDARSNFDLSMQSVLHNGELISCREQKLNPSLGWALILFMALLLAPKPAIAIQRNKPSSLTAENVRESIQRGVQFLKTQASPSGSYGRIQTPEDITALCVLALMNAEVPADDPKVRKSLELIESVPAEQLTTYFVSLRIMAFATADPSGKRYLRQISSDTRWLVAQQITRTRASGGWGYGRGRGGGDASNSQFALLALHEAAKLGIEVPQKTWQLAEKYWKFVSTKDGGFNYNGSGGASGSMTCAGISSWIIIQENLAANANKVNGDRADCCGENQRLDRVERAIDWMASKFRVRGNPGQGHSGSQLYYLYGMERAGRLAGRRFFGAHDWYREGAEELLRQQNQQSGWWKGGGHSEKIEEIATALALLFLSKGKRPIAIGKAAWSDDERWDQHPKGVHYLTRRLEKEWNERLNWQTVRTASASTDDLLEAPVLFLSGRDALEISAKEKTALKEYLENGGFLFAEACQGEGCGDAAFDQAFRTLMAEILPDSQLQPLPPDHPIWRAYFPLLPNPERPLLGIQSCCRTSVIYCPANLSCYWSLDRPGIAPNPRLKKRIETCIQIGVNVVTYATGKELREKGETPKLAAGTEDLLSGRSLVLPKLAHRGGSDDAPNAWRNILQDVSSLGLRVETEKKLIVPNLEQLAEHPFVFLHGRSSFQFTDEERAALKTWLEVGGFIFADSVCASPQFTNSFRKEIQLITGQQLRPIGRDNPIWTDRFGYTIDQVTFRTRDPNAKGGFRTERRPPELESIEIDGQLRVIFSPWDLSCAMENTAFSQCDGYSREDASRIATNVILYRLLSD